MHMKTQNIFKIQLKFFLFYYYFDLLGRLSSSFLPNFIDAIGPENIEDEVVKSEDGSENSEEFREEKQDVFKVKSSFWQRGFKKLVKKLKPLAAFLGKLRNNGCC
jgi:hypothetical protein